MFDLRAMPWNWQRSDRSGKGGKGALLAKGFGKEAASKRGTGNRRNRERDTGNGQPLDEESIQQMIAALEEAGGAIRMGSFMSKFTGIKKSQIVASGIGVFLDQATKGDDIVALSEEHAEAFRLNPPPPRETSKKRRRKLMDSDKVLDADVVARLEDLISSVGGAVRLGNVREMVPGVRESELASAGFFTVAPDATLGDLDCIVGISLDAVDQFSAPPEQFDASLLNEGERFDAETETQLDVWAAANDATTENACHEELRQKGIVPSHFRDRSKRSFDPEAGGLKGAEPEVEQPQGPTATKEPIRTFLEAIGGACRQGALMSKFVDVEIAQVQADFVFLEDPVTNGDEIVGLDEASCFNFLEIMVEIRTHLEAIGGACRQGALMSKFVGVKKAQVQADFVILKDPATNGDDIVGLDEASCQKFLVENPFFPTRQKKRARTS